MVAYEMRWIDRIVSMVVSWVFVVRMDDCSDLGDRWLTINV